MKEVLDYNLENGVFTWKISPVPRVKVGAIAGCLRKDGRWGIIYRKKAYLSHRLVWLYVYGEFPEKESDIDHIDRNPLNNRISNLRKCSRSENTRNTRLRSNNTSGFKGVSLDKRAGKYVARGQVNGKEEYLGGYLTPEEASEVYENWCKKQHGKFYNNTTKGDK